MKPMQCRTLPGCTQGLPAARIPRAVSKRRVIRPTAAASWKVQIYSHTPYDVDAKSNIEIQIVSSESGQQSPATSVNPWSIDSWDRQDELLPGRIRTGTITLQDNFGSPGGVVITKGPGAGDGSYISHVKLTSGSTELLVACNSWVWENKQPRIFFLGAALPKDTAPGLKDLRAKELEALKGTEAQRTQERKPGERIFDYDIFSDLGGSADRPNLGGEKYPFPRRLRTNRPVKDGKEVRPKSAGGWWLPPDEKFSYTKNTGFSTGTIVAALPAILPIVKSKLGKKSQFKSFKEVFSLLDPEGEGLNSLLPKNLPYDAEPSNKDSLDLGTVLKFSQDEAKAVDISLSQAISGTAAKSKLLDTIIKPDSPLAKPLDWIQKKTEEKLSNLKNIWVLFQGVDDFSDVFNFKVPKVLKHRVDAWHSDEEFGRQAFAGVDPVWVKVAKALPADTAITEADVKDYLEGATLDSLFAQDKPRLFLLDFVPVLKDFLESKQKDVGALHAGRALLFKKSNGQVVPVAIELQSKSTGPVSVYTPKDEQVWLLAKQVISNLDAVVHQGYSHYARCHASTEPYIISTYRNLSALHPVYQLLRPHFRYTLAINTNARSSLINAGGVVESTFTPGPDTMYLVSKVYGAIWRFDTEGLPGDLKNRGFMDSNGKLLVDDYPYAEDGLLIWDALTTWFKDYLSLYYKSDADIKSDTELTTWWDEIKTKGHPDKKEGWPELNTLNDLVNILGTITWITSAHHSAVNFVQYDFTAFTLNKPSWIQKHIPAPGTPEFEALRKANGPEFEKLFLSYLPSPDKASLVALVVKLLSNHSLDEEYLATPDHDWIKSGPGKEAFNRFVASINNVEEKIKARNADPSKLSRNASKGGLPYEVLLPSSPEPGVTARGVPYSVSI